MRSSHKAGRTALLGFTIAAVLATACAGDTTEDPTATGAPETTGTEVEAQTLRVGVIAPLTGPAAAIGVPAVDAAQAVVDARNAEGGHQIELVVRDTKTDPTEAARVATELIESENVPVLLGPIIGSAALAMAPIAEEAGVPFLTASATPGVVDETASWFPYVFGLTLDDTVFAPSLIERIAGDGAETIAIFHQEDAYGEFGNEQFSAAAEDQGLEVIESRSAPLDAQDVSAQAQSIAAAQPDAVIVQVNNVELATNFVVAAGQAGLEPGQMYGSTGLAQQAFLDSAGEAAEGMKLVAWVRTDEPTAAQQELWAMIEAAGKTPTMSFIDLLLSSGINVLYDVMDRTTDLSSAGIIAALNQTTDVPSFFNATYVFTEEDHRGLSPDAAMPVIAQGGVFVLDE